METIHFHNIDQKNSRIGLGTWSIGGWLWGGTDEKESIATIRTAIDYGINLIDTAPVYGFGLAETFVGKALKEYSNRDEIVLVTKAGMEWYDNQKQPVRNSTRARIRKEIEDSLKRLQTDYIDVYMIHWPDPLTPFSEPAEVMQELMDNGKIRSIAVSNYSVDQMDAFRQSAPIHVNEPPYNLFEREIEDDILPYCKTKDIRTLAYGPICRGLLSGRMNKDTQFKGDDFRNIDPKFKPGSFEMYLEAVRKLDAFARERYNRSVLHLAFRWVLDRGASVALWGARRPSQLDGLRGIFGWNIDAEGMQEIDKILKETITRSAKFALSGPPNRETEK